MSESSDSELVGHSLTRALAVLNRGGVIAFPTETYYGLGVDPENESAVLKLFKIKQRQTDKPVLLLIEKKSQLAEIVQKIPPEYSPLIEKHWPGPLTLIFPAQQTVSSLLTGNTGTVGVRISPHPTALALVKKMGKPITATSANISGFPPAKTACEVVAMFGKNVDYVVDGGETPSGLCSTVLTMQKGRLNIIRQGKVVVAADLIGSGKL